MKIAAIQSIIKLFLIIQLFFIASSVFAQKKAINTHVKITVHVKDPILAKNPLTLTIVKDYIYANIGSDEYTVLADANGYYRFTVLDISELVNFSISCNTLSYQIIGGYIEPGDNVLIEYTGTEIRKMKAGDFNFSGPGSKKFALNNLLVHTYPNNQVESDPRSNPDMKYLAKFGATADSSYIFYKRILDTYKKNISRPVYEVLNAEIYGKANMSTIRYLTNFFNLNPNVNLNFKDSILLYLPKLETKKFYGFSSLALQSRNYLTYLSSKANEAVHLKHNSYKIQDVYKELILQNTGLVREKILTGFLLKTRAGRKDDNIDSVFKDALKYIHNPKYKKLLTELANNLRVGAKAYPFILPDSTGKMVSLNDFKGKTVILDCWFTGCGPCADLAEIIDQKILPKYIDNKDVVFISVCTDMLESTWKKSLRNGKYTNPKSINLFTEGLALNHPFIKNYNFQSFPKLMLIDKDGGIYTPALPRNPEDMIEIIDKALKK